MASLQGQHALQRTIRVEDYLNDKLQTIADLSSIDALLNDAKNQQSLLEEQLVEARKAQGDATHKSQAFDRALADRAKNFQKQQSDLDRRLKVLGQSEISDETSARFRSPVVKLQQFEVAQGYIGLLIEVERLIGQSNFRSTQEALKPYLRLQELGNKLREAQPAAEDAAPHLIHHVEIAAQRLWLRLKEEFSKDLEGTLKKMNWPTNGLLDGQVREEWEKNVKRLLELQDPKLKDEATVLLPLEVMVKPLELRFKYHFEGNRPTNKIDKPEYFLSHVINLLNTYDEFFAIHLQPILRQHFKGRSLSLVSTNIDSTSALITALLPMLRTKSYTIARVAPPHVLSHLIHELMSFDETIRNEWFYDGGDAVNGWHGLTGDLLVGKGFFSGWLQIEKDFALARYESIINNPEAFQIDMDSEATKPTYAAVRVNDLLEAITDRYRPLREFSQKLQFLIDIQIAIFDMFHNKLRDSLTAYQTLTSSIGRIQGAEDLQGLEGLERLCRILGSSEFLEKKMRDWSDDVFFVELWDELQIKSETPDDTGALFDETSSAYGRLRAKTEEVLQTRLATGIKDSIRPYGRINPWSTADSSASLTSELDATVQYLEQNMGYLVSILSPASLRRVRRNIADILQAFLWDKVLMRYIFSTSGVAQFKRDVETVSRTLPASMNRVMDAITLLSLPVEPDDAQSFDGLGFWEVEKRVFENNDSARDVLAELGIGIPAVDAREVLCRKLERCSA